MPLPSLPWCSVQVEAGTFSAEALTAGACLAVVRNTQRLCVIKKPAQGRGSYLCVHRLIFVGCEPTLSPQVY